MNSVGERGSVGAAQCIHLAGGRLAMGSLTWGLILVPYCRMGDHVKRADSAAIFIHCEREMIESTLG